jgi:rod shape-determining protein MreD
MKAFIFVLILAAFIQSTVLPINLVLLLIIIRSYIRIERENLYLAFAFGLFLSLLEHTPLGLYSLLYLILVEVTHLFSKAPISRNFFTVIPIMVVLLVVNDVVTSLIEGISIHIFPQILVEGILILPIYIVLRMWEERFIVRKEVRLKV